MSTMCDVEDVIMQDFQGEYGERNADEKPALGSSAANAFILLHLDGTFIPLKPFDHSGLTEVERKDPSGALVAPGFDPSTVLVAAGLDRFVELVSNWNNNVDVDSVESFVLSYNAPERKSSMRGTSVPVTTNSISENLYLPNSGFSLSSVKCDHSYAVEDCLSNSDPYSISELQSEVVLLSNVSPQWRPWVQLVQHYLQVQPNASSIDYGTLRAAVAIRRGVRINWSLPLSRFIHKCLVDFKRTPGELQCASYLSVLVQALCPKAVVQALFPKKDPETRKHLESSSSSKVSQVEMNAEILLLQEFHNFKTEREKGDGDVDTKALVTANADLKTQLENYRTQLEKQTQRTQTSLLEVESLRQISEENVARLSEVEECSRGKQRELDACCLFIKNLQNQLAGSELEARRYEGAAASAKRMLREAEDKVAHLEKSFFMEKGNRENLEELQRTSEQELMALRKFYCDFAFMRGPVDDALYTALKLEKEFVEAGFVASQPQSVSFSSLFELEKKLPPAISLEETYQWEMEVFFLQTGLLHKEYISASRFEFLWNKACFIRSENLFTEVLARGDLLLDDPAAAYLLVGDYGARVLQYHAQLESRVARRQRDSVLRGSTLWKVDAKWLTQNLPQALCTWDVIRHEKSISPLTEMQQRLAPLANEFASDSWMRDLVNHCQERCISGNTVDVHPAAYLRSYHITKARLKAKICAKNVNELPQVDVDDELVFRKPRLDEEVQALSGTSENFVLWMLPAPDFVHALESYYLGNWPHLFSSSRDAPFPTWEAMKWIGKDHRHVDRGPLVPLGVLQKRNFVRCSVLPPISVRSLPDYCPCPRRYSWATDATWDSVWYNWPIIPGDFDTWRNCSESYNRFSEEHRLHKDPVCFRTSIFAAVLGFWCADHQIVVDYRVGGRFTSDMVVYNEIMFHSTRRIRMLELMCQMQFLRDAHDNMIGDSHKEIGTRRGPSYNCIDRHDFFLEKRQKNAAELKAEEIMHLNSYTTELQRLQSG